jgi:AcrR family transcriptional regulator
MARFSSSMADHLPSRTEGKHRRGREIVRAARALMQQTGSTGFSMRTLAEQAGVSIATPYNLFGSKQAIMYAVLDDDLEVYQKRLAGLHVDRVEIFFKAVSLATSLYATEPAFYRAVLSAVYNDGGTEYRSMFGGPRHAMWRGFVQGAVDAGFLDTEVDVDALAITLAHIFFSCILEWAAGELSLAELEVRTQYGFALTLLAMATPASAKRLRERALSMQKRLRRLWKDQRRLARAANA